MLVVQFLKELGNLRIMYIKNILPCSLSCRFMQKENDGVDTLREIILTKSFYRFVNRVIS